MTEDSLIKVTDEAKRTALIDNQKYLQEYQRSIKNPEEFCELINHYLKYPDERIPYIHRGFNKVVSEHTYFHRIASMLKELDLPDEQFKCMEIAADTMNQLLLGQS